MIRRNEFGCDGSCSHAQKDDRPLRNPELKGRQYLPEKAGNPVVRDILRRRFIRHKRKQRLQEERDHG